MSDRAAVTSGLAETWFASELSDHARRGLAELGELRRYEAGEEVTREGDEATELGVVLAGRLALRMLVPERGMVTILTVEPGDIYGWSAIVPPHVATSSAVAAEATDAIAFDGARLRAALDRDPLLAAALYPRVLAALARRLTATRLQLLDLFASGAEPW